VLDYKKQIFEETYSKHLLKIIFFADHYLDSREEAECVAHEVFITLWNKLNDIDLTKDLFPYIITVAKNKCLNIIKARKVKARFLEHGKTVMNMDWVNCFALEEPVSKLYSSDLESIIKKSLRQMTKAVRETFILSRYKEMSYKEISELEGITLKAVEYRIMSALRILRKNCTDYFMIFCGIIASILCYII